MKQGTKEETTGPTAGIARAHPPAINKISNDRRPNKSKKLPIVCGGNTTSVGWSMYFQVEITFFHHFNDIPLLPYYSVPQNISRQVEELLVARRK